MGEDWAIFQNVYIGGTYSPAPDNSSPCLLVYIFFVGPFLLGTTCLLIFQILFCRYFRDCWKQSLYFQNCEQGFLEGIWNPSFIDIIIFRTQHLLLRPSPVIWNRRGDENGILGGNWHFRWGYFFHVRLENSCIKNREYESQRKKMTPIVISIIPYFWSPTLTSFW